MNFQSKSEESINPCLGRQACKSVFKTITPFDALGGRGKMWQLFGEEMDGVIHELNEVLVS
jgi:hypothetical protein